MEIIRANSVGELEELALIYGDDCIFRGQFEHYDADGGQPSLQASFDRQGCIPSEMGKWSRFAASAINSWIGEAAGSQEVSQAILQHYGWRSFFIDLSSSFEVATWFASHKHELSPTLELCEDCFESPIFLRKQIATYSLGSLVGNIYILDKEKLVKSNLLVNLEELKIEAKRPRFRAQSAWLAGPLGGKVLPAEYFLAHVTAPHAVLAKFSKQRGLSKTSDLFPDADEDPLLGALLDLPWLELNSSSREMGIPAFRGVIEFPNYYDTFSKINSSHVAFYRGQMIADSDLEIAKNESVTFVKVSDIIVFGFPQPVVCKLPKILSHLELNKSLCFEVDTLLKSGLFHQNSLYCKGVALTKWAENIVEVSELLVDHPGMKVADAGINAGWFYEVNETGEWSHINHPNECPCGNSSHHEFLFGCLTIVEDLLV